MQILQHLSNCFLNSLNCLLIYLLTYSDYITSLFGQFDNLQHTRVEECDRSDAQRKQQMELLATQAAASYEMRLSVRSIWFTDEHTFKAAMAVNSQNANA